MKVVYTSKPNKLDWKSFNPLLIFKDLLKRRELITSITIQNFRAAYQASYLGITWQIFLPMIMLALYYFVFGLVLGGRFYQTAIESPLDYALALFVGLSIFNFFAQNIGSAPSLIVSNQVFVKTLAFPLEVIPITNVLNSLLSLVINLMLSLGIFLLTKHFLYFTTIYLIFYLICILIITAGISWLLSAAAVFVRDISAIVGPLTLILMFMCPIFYPLSAVPNKLKWVITFNPVAVIIEGARASMLYGVTPSTQSFVYIFLIAISVGVVGYNFFKYSKYIFADYL